MPDINSHWLVPNVVIATSSVPAVSAEPYSFGAALAFTIGSLAPDIGDLGYWTKMWSEGRAHAPWRSDWSGQLFDWMDKHSWFSVPYHVTHSLLFLIMIGSLLVEYMPYDFAKWYLYGHALHLLLDLPTHDRCWLFWPIVKSPIIVPVSNWYEWRLYKKNAWEIAIIGTPVNSVFCAIILGLAYF